ncbi:putative ABC transport system ATP-binding protein [Alphaproteobacteria bacterium]
MLKLDNICIMYDKGTILEHIVLNSVNLEIFEGDFVGVIGGNGVGKSTFVRVISGEIKADQGKIFIDKEDCTHMNVVQRSKLLSSVFQDPMNGVAPDLTVLENLTFAGKRGEVRKFCIALNKQKREFYAEKVKILNMGLEDRLDYKVQLLSGGQRQALSMVMATLRSAKLLILDEHTASLNPKSAELVMELTSKIVRDHRLTTIMITHDMKGASYCDKVLTIEDGNVKYVGDYHSYHQ